MVKWGSSQVPLLLFCPRHEIRLLVITPNTTLIRDVAMFDLILIQQFFTPINTLILNWWLYGGRGASAPEAIALYSTSLFAVRLSAWLREVNVTLIRRNQILIYPQHSTTQVSGFLMLVTNAWTCTLAVISLKEKAWHGTSHVLGAIINPHLPISISSTWNIRYEF